MKETGLLGLLSALKPVLAGGEGAGHLWGWLGPSALRLSALGVPSCVLDF